MKQEVINNGLLTLSNVSLYMTVIAYGKFYTIMFLALHYTIFGFTLLSWK